MLEFAFQYTILVALLAGASCVCNAASFPPPIGRYGTSIVTAELIDHHRLDPYAPDREPRALMISIFLPVDSAVCNLHAIPYMDSITAAFEDSEYADVGVPPGAVESLSLEECLQSSKSNKNYNTLKVAPSYPLVLFSTGMGTVGSFIAQWHSSKCFMIAWCH